MAWHATIWCRLSVWLALRDSTTGHADDPVGHPYCQKVDWIKFLCGGCWPNDGPRGPINNSFAHRNPRWDSCVFRSAGFLLCDPRPRSLGAQTPACSVKRTSHTRMALIGRYRTWVSHRSQVVGVVFLGSVWYLHVYCGSEPSGSARHAACSGNWPRGPECDCAFSSSLRNLPTWLAWLDNRERWMG